MKHETNPSAEIITDLFNSKPKQYLSADSICKSTGLTKDEVKEGLKELEPKLQIYRQISRTYYRLAIQSETAKELERWFKPFTEMTPESYKKHVLRGVVSV